MKIKNPIKNSMKCKFHIYIYIIIKTIKILWEFHEIPSKPPHEFLWFSTFLRGRPLRRRQAELDAQLLANRIALLKQEEEKAPAHVYQWLMVF